MKILNFQERVDFVENVVNMCNVLVDDNGNDIFHPAIFDVAFRIYILKYFFDVDIEDMDVNALCELAYSEKYTKQLEDGEFDEVVIFNNQADSLKDACMIKIEQMHQEKMNNAILNKKDKLDELMDIIENWLNSMKDKLEGVDVNELTEAANKIVAMGNNQAQKDAIALKVVKGKKDKTNK